MTKPTPIFRCPKCGDKFTARGALVWHMMQKHPKK